MSQWKPSEAYLRRLKAERLASLRRREWWSDEAEDSRLRTRGHPHFFPVEREAA